VQGFRFHHAALALSVAALALAGCGSSSSTSSESPAVQQGNAPVKTAFDAPGYPAACHKSLETPNSHGAAFSPSQAQVFCGCLQQQAQSRGLSSQSEQSITLDQYKSIFAACKSSLSSSGSSGSSGGTATY
jgi:hypothetical protein